jgi:hypothetical protein
MLTIMSTQSTQERAWADCRVIQLCPASIIFAEDRRDYFMHGADPEGIGVSLIPSLFTSLPQLSELVEQGYFPGIAAVSG